MEKNFHNFAQKPRACEPHWSHKRPAHWKGERGKLVHPKERDYSSAPSAGSSAAATLESRSMLG